MRRPRIVSLENRVRGVLHLPQLRPAGTLGPAGRADLVEEVGLTAGLAGFLGTLAEQSLAGTWHIGAAAGAVIAFVLWRRARA